MSNDHGDLRALLHQMPTPERWLELGALLAQADDADRPALYAQARSYLRSWPGALRQALDLTRNDVRPLARALWPLARHVVESNCAFTTYRADRFERLLESLALADIALVSMVNCALDDTLLARLLERVDGPDLHTLLLRGNRFGDASVTALAALAAAPHLKTLDLSANALGAPALERLARVPFPALRRLWLYNVDMAEASDHVREMLAAPWPALKTLGLSARALEPEALAPRTSPERLDTLSLRHDVSASQLEALSRGDLAGRLAALSLRDCALSVQAAEALGRSRRLHALRSLELWNCQLSGASLDALWGSPVAAKLSCLRLVQDHIAPRAWTQATASALPRLEHLELRDLEHLDARALHALTLPSLRRLELTGMRLAAYTDEPYLARAPGLEQLEELTLARCGLARLGDLLTCGRLAGLKALALLDMGDSVATLDLVRALEGLPNLERLTLSRALPDEAEHELRQRGVALAWASSAPPRRARRWTY